MRCECCDALLTDEETRTKFTVSQEFTNTCYKCLATMDIPYSKPKAPYEEDAVKVDDSVDDWGWEEDFWDER